MQIAICISVENYAVNKIVLLLLHETRQFCIIVICISLGQGKETK